MKSVLFSLLFISICGSALAQKGKIKAKDYPKILNSGEDTLEVTYIAWACACPNWLPTQYLAIPNYSTTENTGDCIFIEAANKKIRIPEAYHVGGNGNRIRLIGQYYEDEGISRDYIQQTSELPQKARVFRYRQVELVKPYTIWENVDGRSVKKTIPEGMSLDFEKR